MFIRILRPILINHFPNNYGRLQHSLDLNGPSKTMLWCCGAGWCCGGWCCAGWCCAGCLLSLTFSSQQKTPRLVTSYITEQILVTISPKKTTNFAFNFSTNLTSMTEVMNQTTFTCLYLYALAQIIRTSTFVRLTGGKGNNAQGKDNHRIHI